MKFNKLQLLDYTEPKVRVNGSKRIMAIFVCDCGNEKVYDFQSVKSGHTKQCLDCARKSAAQSRKTHGLIKHPLYRKWQDMKNRCKNPNVDRYACYGGRGISVCKEWEEGSNDIWWDNLGERNDFVGGIVEPQHRVATICTQDDGVKTKKDGQQDAVEQ